MPQVFTDNTGNRVIIRHKGPAGRGIPTGGANGQILVKDSANDFDTYWANPPDGTGAVVGPALAVSNNIATFDGITGKLIKDSGVALGSLATTSNLALKENSVAGKGLSTEDYSTLDKTKLTNLSVATFRGVFTSKLSIDAYDFNPYPVAGDYCVIEVSGETIQEVIWDDTNALWTVVVPDAVDMTGQQIADVLFDADDALVWDQDTCRIFTEAEKAQLAAHEALIGSLGLGTITPAYGGINYFSTTGTVLTLIGTSDGLSNMYKVDVTTALATTVSGFDNGGTSDGRLRYTGTTSRVFQITANLSLEGTVVGDFVVGLAKNGAVIQESRHITAINTNNDTENVTLSVLVTLLNNEYVELFLGRLSGALNPTVHALSIVAVKVP